MTPYYADQFVTLYLADCREILPTLQAESVGLLLTDVPYGISSGDGSARGPREDRRLDYFESDQNSQECERVILSALGSSLPLLTPSASIYCWTGHLMFGPVVASLVRAGWSTRPLYWHKPSAPPAMPGSGWSSCVELGCYAYRPGRTWKYTTNAPRHLISCDPPKQERYHPTQKPVELMSLTLRASSNVGDLVLDPFAGSGTTLVAARAMGRKVVGIEIEERFCEAAALRLSQQTLGMAHESDKQEGELKDQGRLF